MCNLQSPACAVSLALSGLLPSTLSFTKLTLLPSGLSLGVILLCKAFQNPPRWVGSLTHRVRGYPMNTSIVAFTMHLFTFLPHLETSDAPPISSFTFRRSWYTDDLTSSLFLDSSLPPYSCASSHSIFYNSLLNDTSASCLHTPAPSRDCP